MKCRLCGKTVNECGGWLERVNEKGVPGIWECRPNCDDELPRDDAVLLAIQHPNEAREALLYGKALRKSSTETSDWRLASCTWTQDEDDGFWYTECGNAYEFMEDGPEENNHKFCPYCGGRLHQMPRS